MAKTERISAYVEPETKAALETWIEQQPYPLTLSAAATYAIQEFLKSENQYNDTRRA
jgi:hypothetical protein